MNISEPNFGIFFLFFIIQTCMNISELNYRIFFYVTGDNSTLWNTSWPMTQSRDSIDYLIILNYFLSPVKATNAGICSQRKQEI